MVITAIPAGFAAGLFGIGGGLITVPILFYIFGAAGIDPEYLMHLAVGTSFGIIIPTSIVSVLTHYQHNAVDFGVVKGYGVFVIIGVILGTILAAGLKTKPLILFLIPILLSVSHIRVWLLENTIMPNFFSNFSKIDNAGKAVHEINKAWAPFNFILDKTLNKYWSF